MDVSQITQVSILLTAGIMNAKTTRSKLQL